MTETALRWQEAIASADPQQIAAVRRMAEARLREDGTDFEALEAEVHLLAYDRLHGLAQQLLDEFIRYYPNHEEASLLNAWILSDLGKEDEAQAERRALLARSPTFAPGWIALAEGEEKLGRWKECLSVATSGLEHHPANEKLAVLSGRAYHRLGNEAGAAQAYALALEISHGANTAAKFGLAQVAAARQQHQRLLELARELEQASGLTVNERIQVTDFYFLANHPSEGQRLAERYATDPSLESDEPTRFLMDIVYGRLGKSEADQFFLALLKAQRANDSVGVELLELAAEQRARKVLEEIYQIATKAPLRYPRTMGRILSTFHTIPMIPGALGRWISQNQAVFQQSVHLWGAVGAYHVARGKWKDAEQHLASWKFRQGIKPWMLLLYGIAKEKLGDYTSANESYRAALNLPPDHTEAEIRSRLAYNLALAGLPGNARLILADASPRMSRRPTRPAAARQIAVDALFEATHLDDFLAVKEAFDRGAEEIRRLAGLEKNEELTEIARQYKERTNEVLGFIARRENG